MITSQKSISFSSRGFTLVELAIVLVIVGFLVSAFLTPLSAQLDQSRNAEARRDLDEIKDVLLGFVVINGRLPCPDVTGDGIQDPCANASNAASTGGNLPWVTLGLKSTDPWNRTYQYRVNNAFTTNFTLNTAGTGAGIIRVCTDNTCAVTESANVPTLVFSRGKNGAILPPVSLDEQENSNGDGTFVNHGFADGVNAYDDLVSWLSTGSIMNRMVAAGRLP
jgi:prepilin-type N-terminal cleavage/methylation domain-containing protein